MAGSDDSAGQSGTGMRLLRGKCLWGGSRAGSNLRGAMSVLRALWLMWLLGTSLVGSGCATSAGAAQGRDITITAIELHSKGSWPRQMWRVKYCSDGAAEWSAEYEPRVGRHVGMISNKQWNRLVTLAAILRITDWRSEYAVSDVDDAPEITITITDQSGRREVRDYAGAGPVELWAMQMVMRGMAEAVTWQRKD